jgi:hypothetical protein
MIAALGEALSACSAARLAFVLPVIQDIFQCDEELDICRAAALHVLVNTSPMDDAAFGIMHSCGVLAYCVHTVGRGGSAVGLLQRALQFIGLFTDEHHATTQWAVDLGLVPALVTLCSSAAALPFTVTKEALWIVADLACSTAGIRVALLQQAVLCALPAAVLCSGTAHAVPEDLRAAAAAVLTIVMENTDAKVVQYMTSLHTVQGFAAALRDGVPVDVAANVLTTLEDMFLVFPPTLSEFVAHGGIDVLESLQQRFARTSASYQAHRIAETYGLTA